MAEEAIVETQTAAPAPQGRRSVDLKETVGFVLFDVAASINIQKGDNEFADRILNVDRGLQAVMGTVVQIWDVINDVFLASLVDKTRTRFGKFRPYLIAYPAYGIPMSTLLYLLPFFFWGSSSTFLPKFIAFLLVKIFNNLTGSLSGICRTGMIANITADTKERLLLITKAQFFSMFGEELPQQIFMLLRDVISRSNKMPPAEIDLQLRKLYLIFGVGTVVLSGMLSLYFAIISKERVFGSDQTGEKPPTLRETLRGLRANRPLYMLMLAEILGGFGIKDQMNTYITSILNFANFRLVSGIPGSPISYLSYAYVPKLREKFSTKALWILSDYVNTPLYIALFFFGITRVKNENKISNGITRRFMDLVPMLIAFGTQNTIDMAFYGSRKVIPEEIRNECIDYGEWKNGFRSEGIVGVMRSLPKKFTDTFGKVATDLLLKAMHFKTGADYRNQSAKTQMGVFALATIIPCVTALLSLVPKLFFNIDQKTREQMYAELAERRALTLAAETEKNV
ncbi:MAG: MFS transporter [Oscillospiraceae bacterium]|nr:MFS transporter [Oscillospiraceae bacterium]